MGHLPVITNVWRCTLNWNTHAGVTPRNVIHLLDGDGGHPAATIFSNLQGALVDDMFSAVCSGFFVNSVDLLKLDGSAATVNEVTDGSDKWAGRTGGECVPNSAAVIKLATGIRGRSNRGRVYLGPIAEASLEEGNVRTSDLEILTPAWVGFANNLVDRGYPLVVASYRHAEAHQVINLVARRRSGSVRRRLDQLAL